MEAYKAKARIWNIPWEGHEIRFELFKKANSHDSLYEYSLFFDGKPVTITGMSAHDFDGIREIRATVQLDDGTSYILDCGEYRKSWSDYLLPLRRSFWGRIEDRIGRLLTSMQRHAWFNINDKPVYLTHIGGEEKIEYVLIQQELDFLIDNEQALAEGKIVIRCSGRRNEKRKVSEEELEQAKIRLTDERKELEGRLSDWKAKNKKLHGWVKYYLKKRNL